MIGGRCLAIRLVGLLQLAAVVSKQEVDGTLLNRPTTLCAEQNGDLRVADRVHAAAIGVHAGADGTRTQMLLGSVRGSCDRCA